MSTPIDFLLITSSVGAVQSGFFGLFLVSAANQRRPSSRLLGLLLLALAVRMAKSVGYYFAGDSLPALIENIGYSAHLAIAPLLFLYVRSFGDERFVLRKRHLQHLLPAVVVLLVSPLLDDWFWLAKGGGYFVSLYYFGAYFPFIYYSLIKNRVSKEEKAWLLLLTIGINLVWGGYAANFLLGLVPYITAPLIFTFVIYGISFIALRKRDLFFTKLAKYQNSLLSPEQIRDFADSIEWMMSTDKIHRDSRLTLPKLAKRLGVSPQTASEIINRHFRMSFADFLNSYRLTDAREMLKDTQNIDRKIATIAFESGFGTISTFNTTFKKHTGMTPSEYKQKTQKL